MSSVLFEHREIDYGGPSTMAECDLGTESIGGLEYRAYRCTKDGRLSPRALHALVVCMSCRRSLYESRSYNTVWYMNPMVESHHLSCEGSTS